MLGTVIAHNGAFLATRQDAISASKPLALGTCFRSFTDSNLLRFFKGCVPKTKRRRDVPKNLMYKKGLKMTLGHDFYPRVPRSARVTGVREKKSVTGKVINDVLVGLSL